MINAIFNLIFVKTAFLILAYLLFTSQSGLLAKPSEQFSPMPEKLTNNAVVAVKSQKGWKLFSFNGLGASKGHQAVSSSAWSYDLEGNRWTQLASVPDSKAMAGGRLASIAVAVGNNIYLLGGYTVAVDDAEISTPETNVYDVDNNLWLKAADMPIPVDDSVALVYQNRYIYLVSGWHNDGNINDVQIFDTVKSSWQSASNFPGPAVFGHAAGIVNNQIIIANGVKVESIINGRRQYKISEDVWLGTIDLNDITKIDWRQLNNFPGGGRYRMAATADVRKPWVHFVGGSLNPYNYNGIGYNKVPSQPESSSYAYDILNNEWLDCGKKQPASMDHRGLIAFEGSYLTIGGMLKDQQVIADILAFTPECKK